MSTLLMTLFQRFQLGHSSVVKVGEDCCRRLTPIERITPYSIFCILFVLTIRYLAEGLFPAMNVRF